MRKNFNYRLLIMACGWAIFATGCATVYNPATQKKEMILISSSEEVQIGRSMKENIIKKEREPLNDASKQLLVNKVGQRVAHVSDRTDIIYNFMVLDDTDLNAFALPGGYIFIYSGLLNKINEAQLAAVLAHEVAHVAAKHSVKKMQSSLGYTMLASIALASFGNQNPAIAQEIAGLSDIVYDLLSKGYGREDELFADKLAVQYLRRCGYDPVSLIEVLELLTKQQGPGGKVFEVLSDHPRMEERMRKIKDVL